MKKDNEKVSFNGLNEIRAVAALSVLFHHLELFKYREKIPSLYDIHILKNFILYLGKNGVILFFTLSGFLITYLLLAEKKKYDTIDIKAFYIRRILRIWPLYFVIIIIGFVVMPIIAKGDFFSNQKHYPRLVEELNYGALFLFIFFMSNFALRMYRPIAAAAQSWSVSVEEQFYLIWPWLIKYIYKFKILLLILFLLPVLKYVWESYHILPDKVVMISRAIQIEYMCVGAIYAVTLFNCKIPDFVLKYKNSFLIFLLTAIIFFLNYYNYTLLLSVLFGGLILLLTNSNFKSKLLFYLGTISYGIYMYHPFCMFICFSLSKHITSNIYIFNFIYYPLTVIATITISHLSYYYFESKFLNYKYRFAKINSGA